MSQKRCIIADLTLAEKKFIFRVLNAQGVVGKAKATFSSKKVLIDFDYGGHGASEKITLSFKKETKNEIWQKVLSEIFKRMNYKFKSDVFIQGQKLPVKFDGEQTGEDFLIVKRILLELTKKIQVS